jgi:hypothetical protein
MKMFNIIVKGQGISLGLEARSKVEAIEQIILQYEDLWQIKITEKDILEIYQVIPTKYKGN